MPLEMKEDRMTKPTQRKPEIREDRHPTIPAPKSDGPFAGWGPRLGY
jgi:hypothetical protein